jgi:hypothetical protein
LSQCSLFYWCCLPFLSLCFSESASFLYMIELLGGEERKIWSCWQNSDNTRNRFVFEKVRIPHEQMNSYWFLQLKSLDVCWKIDHQMTIRVEALSKDQRECDSDSFSKCFSLVNGSKYFFIFKNYFWHKHIKII